MTKVLIEDTTLTRIANAVRTVTGTTATMKPSKIPDILLNGVNRVPVSGVTIDTFSGTTQDWYPAKEGSDLIKHKLTATITPDNATNKALTWRSSDSSVVKITYDSTEKAYYAVPVATSGSVTISVTTADGDHTDAFTVNCVAETKWDRLISAGLLGTYATEYPVGTVFETPYVYDGTEYSWKFAVDYSNEVASDGETYLVANLWSVQCSSDDVQYASTTEKSGNPEYRTSTIRTFLNETFLARFTDTEFTKHLASTRVKTLSGHYSESQVIYTTTDKIFLPSWKEINGDVVKSDGYDLEGVVSDYWIQRLGGEKAVDGNKGLRFFGIDGEEITEREPFLLRSAHRGISPDFNDGFSSAIYCVYKQKIWTVGVPTSSGRVAPACRILLKRLS